MKDFLDLRRLHRTMPHRSQSRPGDERIERPKNDLASQGMCDVHRQMHRFHYVL